MKKILMAIMMVTSLTLVPATAQAKKKYIDYGKMLLTAYCPCDDCSSGYGRRCALKGRHAESGRTVAVDPDIIDLGSKVWIDGEMYVAEDVGTHVNGDHIDIFFDTHEEVVKFGKKYGHAKVVK